MRTEIFCFAFFISNASIQSRLIVPYLFSDNNSLISTLLVFLYNMNSFMYSTVQFPDTVDAPIESSDRNLILISSHLIMISNGSRRCLVQYILQNIVHNIYKIGQTLSDLFSSYIIELLYFFYISGSRVLRMVDQPHPLEFKEGPHLISNSKL